MTTYLNEHPGGKAMLRQAGKDAANAMQLIPSHTFARKFIERKLESLCIGRLKYGG